uniref:AP2-1 n=1 Tax=Erycina pusilla TaxID=154679 RepID=M9QR23_9ASPA|nr:AP2-1 [Erycina pusilla]
MASMNNWLNFSLSPQHSLSTDETDCYASNSIPNDWSMKSSLDYKNNTSELSMIVDSSNIKCGNIDDVVNVVDEPKLEDFLGGSTKNIIGSMSNDHYLYTNCSLQVQGVQSTSGENGSIGLSMIKTWLRNQPTPSMENNESVHHDVGKGQSLALSMGGVSEGGGENLLLENEKNFGGNIETVQRKSIDTFGQRTSIYRGVTRHRWTGRYEAHLWDNSCRREGQTRKGRQVYLGGYDKEEKAARAYDLAALKYWGTTTTTNFPISNYEKELDEMKHMTRQEYVASLRRKSSGFSRGASIYRGVTRHHQHGRWQARIGRVAGNKDLYLGTFSTQEEAAEAYDIAAIKFRGLNAVTNFDMSRYDVKSILESSTLPIGGAAKRLKDVVSDKPESTIDAQPSADNATSIAHYGWQPMSFQQQHLGFHYPFAVATLTQQRGWCKPEPDVTLNQDLQQGVQIANTTHNFFQPFGIQNFVGMEEQNSGSSSSMLYGGNGYVIPMSTMVVDGTSGSGGYVNSELKSNLCYENILPSYSASGYDNGNGNGNGWMVNSTQGLGSRTGGGMNTVFSVWNDS